VTACPTCEVTFRDAAAGEVEVFDISEILSKSITKA